MPPQSAHFTLPSPYADNCPSPPDPLDPSCCKFGSLAVAGRLLMIHFKFADLDPLPYSDLPLFATGNSIHTNYMNRSNLSRPMSSLVLTTSARADYIGLRHLDAKKKMHLGVCKGQHMQISDDCWDSIASWLGSGNGRRKGNGEAGGRLILQL